MELATFSDIEFVGIGADRSVIMTANHGERRDSSGASSSVSLLSVGSEVKRHNKSMTASAFDIQEIYTAAPLSPSSFLVGFVPDTLTTYIDDGRHVYQYHQDKPDDDVNRPSLSSWASTHSDTLPLERYRQDSQRHERVAVSVALGRSCDMALPDDKPVFRRSAAPSPSTGRGLNIPGVHSKAAAGAVTAQAIVDPDEHDHRGPYSLERWYGSTMEKADELAVELQHTEPETRRPEPSSELDSDSAPLKTDFKDDHQPPRSSLISHGVLEPDPDVVNNRDTDESLRALSKDALKQFNERRGGAYRTYRASRLRRVSKRKSEDDHPPSRAGRRTLE